MRNIADDLAKLIVELSAVSGDPIVNEQRVRILDHLEIARGLANACDAGIHERAEAARIAAEEAALLQAEDEADDAAAEAKPE